MKIKKFFPISLLLFFLIFISVGHTGAKKSEASPRAVIEKTTVKFSPVIAGSDVTHVFKIQNKGNAILNIPGIYTT
jgi:hypothetical protein